LYRKNEDFIQTWTIPEYVCDDILKYFHDNSQFHEKGISKKGHETQTEAKISTEISMNPNFIEEPFGDYRLALQKCLNEYIEYYPMIDELCRFNILENYNIQHYKKSEGYKVEHFERDGTQNKSIKRCLVFMTYLNDLEAGGTKFINQKRIIQAQKGKTVIFPADWTHAHVGQISKTQEKTIVTGWYSYEWDN
tara:strand:+ start:1471 stop:2049 length:579 start_codon:yes stop_codon:yes gene_type:complete